jgi:hypothetical protein
MPQQNGTDNRCIWINLRTLLLFFRIAAAGPHWLAAIVNAPVYRGFEIKNEQKI